MRQLKFHLHVTLSEQSTCRLLMLLAVHKSIETFTQIQLLIQILLRIYSDSRNYSTTLSQKIFMNILSEVHKTFGGFVNTVMEHDCRDYNSKI